MMHRVTDTLRNRKAASKVIKELDAFPKIPQDYQETSASGGTGELSTENELLFIDIVRKWLIVRASTLQAFAFLSKAVR